MIRGRAEEESQRREDDDEDRLRREERRREEEDEEEWDEEKSYREITDRESRPSPLDLQDISSCCLIPPDNFSNCKRRIIIDRNWTK